MGSRTIQLTKQDLANLFTQDSQSIDEGEWDKVGDKTDTDEIENDVLPEADN